MVFFFLVSEVVVIVVVIVIVVVVIVTSILTVKHVSFYPSSRLASVDDRSRLFPEHEQCLL